jgi:hypothetical protein
MKNLSGSEQQVDRTMQLDCSSYLVFEPDSAFSHSMTSTKLYAESLDQVANKTGRKDGPGWDYSFLPKTYPVTWNIPDLEEQISSFLALQKPQNTPAETLWVFSFGMWDIWSLASEPLSVSKPMVDDILIHLFTQVERVYHSTMDESSIAWSAPLPTPEAAANTTSAKPQQLDFDPEEHDEATEAEEDEPPPKQFKVLIPKLFDPSMTPGWRTHRPDQPAVHSKAEQMRNAAMLTEYWNSVLKRYLFSWARTGQANSKTAQKHTITFASGSKETPTAKEAMANFKASLETEKTSGGKVSSKPVRPRGDLGVAPRSAPEPAGITTSDKAKKQEANQEEDFTPTVERDAILFGMDDYLLDLMVDREMRNAGIQDSKGAGTKPTEEGFLEVRKACTQALEKTQDEVKSGQKKDAKAAESSQPAVRGRGPTPATSPSEVRSDVTQQRICEAPHEHLFLTPFTVSPRAVAAVAKLAADMVRQNQTVRASWTNIPKKLPVKVIPPASRRPHGGGTPAK